SVARATPGSTQGSGPRSGSTPRTPARVAAMPAESSGIDGAGPRTNPRPSPARRLIRISSEAEPPDKVDRLEAFLFERVNHNRRGSIETGRNNARGILSGPRAASGHAN